MIAPVETNAEIFVITEGLSQGKQCLLDWKLLPDYSVNTTTQSIQLSTACICKEQRKNKHGGIYETHPVMKHHFNQYLFFTKYKKVPS